MVTETLSSLPMGFNQSKLSIRSFYYKVFKSYRSFRKAEFGSALRKTAGCAKNDCGSTALPYNTVQFRTHGIPWKETGRFCGPDICIEDHSSCPPSPRCRTGWPRTAGRTSAPEQSIQINNMIYRSLSGRIRKKMWTLSRRYFASTG